MTFIYKPGTRNGSGAPVDPKRCQASVNKGDHRWYQPGQCSKPRGNNGWCKQHDPDGPVKKRLEERYQAKRKAESDRWDKQAENLRRANCFDAMLAALKLAYQWVGNEVRAAVREAIKLAETTEPAP